MSSLPQLDRERGFSRRELLSVVPAKRMERNHVDVLAKPSACRAFELAETGVSQQWTDVLADRRRYLPPIHDQRLRTNLTARFSSEAIRERAGS